MFRDRFRDLERIVIDSESVRLRPYAAELGFRIISIDLDKPLPEHKQKLIEARHRVEPNKGDYEIEQGVSGGKQKSSRPVPQELGTGDVDQREVQQLGLARQDLSPKSDEAPPAQQTSALPDIQTGSPRQALENVAANGETSAKLDDELETGRDTGGTDQPEVAAIPAAAEAPPEASQKVGDDLQPKSFEDREQATLDSSVVHEYPEESLPGESWKDQSSRLIRLLEEAGADADTTMRLRNDLDALGAQYFHGIKAHSAATG
jgi:hypothetical protein